MDFNESYFWWYLLFVFRYLLLWVYSGTLCGTAEKGRWYRSAVCDSYKTHWGLNKIADVFQTTFQMFMLEEISWIHWRFCLKSPDDDTSTLVEVIAWCQQWKTIISTNDETVYKCIYEAEASWGHSEFYKLERKCLFPCSMSVSI